MEWITHLSPKSWIIVASLESSIPSRIRKAIFDYYSVITQNSRIVRHKGVPSFDLFSFFVKSLIYHMRNISSDRSLAIISKTAISATIFIFASIFCTFTIADELPMCYVPNISKFSEFIPEYLSFILRFQLPLPDYHFPYRWLRHQISNSLSVGEVRNAA